MVKGPMMKKVIIEGYPDIMFYSDFEDAPKTFRAMLYGIDNALTHILSESEVSDEAKAVIREMYPHVEIEIYGEGEKDNIVRSAVTREELLAYTHFEDHIAEEKQLAEAIENGSVH